MPRMNPKIKVMGAIPSPRASIANRTLVTTMARVAKTDNVAKSPRWGAFRRSPSSTSVLLARVATATTRLVIVPDGFDTVARSPTAGLSPRSAETNSRSDSAGSLTSRTAHPRLVQPGGLNSSMTITPRTAKSTTAAENTLPGLLRSAPAVWSERPGGGPYSAMMVGRPRAPRPTVSFRPTTVMTRTRSAIVEARCAGHTGDAQ